MDKIIELDVEVAGVEVQCKCGNLSWKVYTDEQIRDYTQILAIKCTRCHTIARVKEKDAYNYNNVFACASAAKL